MAKKARFDVVLNAKMLEVFNEIKEIEGGSKSEIFDKAMLTYYYIKKQTSEGSQILVKEKNSQEIKNLVLL